MSKRPKHVSLSTNYHDGELQRVEFGPHCEIVLSIRVDPVWNSGSDALRRIQFSAIRNYAEAKAFFGGRSVGSADEPSLDTVLAIVRPAKTVIGLDFAKLGYIELQGAKVSEL